MNQINLISPEYQSNYLKATKDAALTGDSVYEVRINPCIVFATGQVLEKMLEEEKNRASN